MFVSKLIHNINFVIFEFNRSILNFSFWEFFTSALADGFLLEFEWQQVSSTLQDSFQYSGRSKKML